MNNHLFSLCTPCPDGFTFCREFRARDFRRAPFALYAPSSEAAREFLGDHLSRLAGLILIPGAHYSFEEAAPLVSQLVIPPSMLPCLEEFASHQLVQLDRLIGSEERLSFLTLENRRFELNNQRASEEFNQFRASLLREIEERRAIESALRESERRFRAIFDQTFQFIGLMALDGTLIEANRAALEFVGAEYVIGRPFWETPWWTHSPELQEKLRAAVKKASAGEFVRFEATHPAVDGNLHYVDFSLKPVTDETGKVVLLIPEGRDITERKQAEEDLRLREHYQRALLDNFPFAAWMKDEDGRYLAVNRQLAAYLDLASPDDLVGKTNFDILPPELSERIAEEDRKVLVSGRTKHAEEQLPVKGVYRWFDVYQSPVAIDGRVIGTVGCNWDITERKRVEEALAESEELFHTLCSSAPIGIFRTDGEGNNIYCSPGWEKITGMSASEGVGRRWVEGIHPDDLAEHEKAWNEAVAAGHIYAHEHRRLTPQGRTNWVRTLASPLKSPDGKVSGYVGTMDEISELRQASQDMLKNQKIESLGVLAGGIAHDFNNILTIILGNISLARFQLHDSEKVSTRLEEAENATVRAKDLAQQLLTFARGGEPVKKIVEVAGLLKEACGFALHGSNVRGEFALAEDLWPVEADEGQLSQVIQNLVLNAVQAMPEGGTVTISAENATTPQEGMRFVKISVADTGAGISEHHLQRIFDPYFTTKQQGSGLGLATCFSIIRKHGGKIRATSVLGKGSTFHISLPASEQESVSKPLSRKAPSHGSGRVLIMDDEEDIRELTQAILEELGYTVESVENGTGAVDLYRKRKEEGTPFSAVILDLTIPGGVGGKETIEQLLRIDPDIKAIVSSGYSTDPIMANYRDYGFRAVLVKPYRPQDISRVLQELPAK